MKWTKRSAFEWDVRTDTVMAEIGKFSGTNGTPYLWFVMPLPRPGEGRWESIAKGSERTLAEAKAAAEAHITD